MINYKSKIIKIKTANTLQNIKEMTKILSEKAGTQEKAKKLIPEPPKNIKVFNAYTGKALALKNNQLQLDLEPYDFAVVEVTADE